MRLKENEVESCYLGQFIPLHYHHNMLMDQNRMENFKAAIEYHVFPGAKVLELGGGTGVLSWFAAQTASHVYCVELNPDLVKEARRLLAKNRHGDRVEVIQADAFEYLPPEPVDTVICEMIHVGMLREKQVQVIENFKQRYREKFGAIVGDKLPIFIPEAVLMAVQPLQQVYDFSGYQAPIIQFQLPGQFSADTQELGQTALYSLIDFQEDQSLIIKADVYVNIEKSGKLTTLRFITKNVLAILQNNSGTIDWLNHYMLLPLEQAFDVMEGDQIHIQFEHRTGASIGALQHTLKVERVAIVEKQFA